MKNESVENEIGNFAKPLLCAGLAWDDDKAEDKAFLILWYQSRIELWSKQPKEISTKIIKRYKDGIKELSKPCT